ncbi:MAG: DNA polymerase III subunit epsilon [Aquabacterium sp.]
MTLPGQGRDVRDPAAPRQVFLDTETTGLSAATGDRVVEIGCLEMVQRRLTGRSMHCYLNPQRPMNPEALQVHGLTDEFLADKPLFAQKADELLAFIAGAEVIIHNADFDVGFLNEELRRIGRGPVSEAVASVTDSLMMARELYPGKANSLDALCRRLEVDNANRALHGALLDAGLLAEVYIRMTRGQESLVIGLDDHAPGAALAADGPNLASLSLPVIDPTLQELAAHEVVLAELDKASNGRTVWRTVMP